MIFVGDTVEDVISLLDPKGNHASGAAGSITATVVNPWHGTALPVVAEINPPGGLYFIDFVPATEGTYTVKWACTSPLAETSHRFIVRDAQDVIADQVWDEAKADHMAAGSMGLEQNRLDDIETDTNEIQTKLPTNNIMGSGVKTDKDDEIDLILVDTNAIVIDTNEIQTKLPTNNIMGSSVKTDKDDEIDAILVDTNEIQTKLPTNNIMGSGVKTDKDDEIDLINTNVGQPTDLVAAGSLQGKIGANAVFVGHDSIKQEVIDLTLAVTKRRIQGL